MSTSPVMISPVSGSHQLSFLPAKSTARKTQLQALRKEYRTIIFYESSHRILDTLTDLSIIFGADRQAFVGREMTKRYEDYQSGSIAHIAAHFISQPDTIKGEFVIVIDGNKTNVDDQQMLNLNDLLTLLLSDLPLKKAVEITIKLTGLKKNLVYETALKLNSEL